MYKPEINIDNKPLERGIAIIAGGHRSGKADLLVKTIEANGLIVLEQGSTNIARGLRVNPIVKPAEYKRFRQGSNFTPKKKKRKK